MSQPTGNDPAQKAEVFKRLRSLLAEAVTSARVTAYREDGYSDYEEIQKIQVSAWNDVNRTISDLERLI